MLPQQPPLFGLRNGNAQVLYGNWILRPDINIPLVRSNGIRSNGHGFNDRMRISFQNAAIHKCAWIAFVCIAANVFLHLPPVSAGKFPLHSGWEPCTAPALQSAFQHCIDHFIRRHLRQHLVQCCIAVHCNVLLNILRINHSAVAQRHPCLTLEKLRLIQTAGCICDLRFIIQQFFYAIAFQKVLIDNASCILNLNMAVNRPLWEHNDIGAR